MESDPSGRGAGELRSPQGCAINIVPGSHERLNLHILGGLVWGFRPSIQLPFSSDGARAHLGGSSWNATAPAGLTLGTHTQIT